MQYLIGGAYHKETTVFPGNFNDQKGSVHFNITSASSNQRFKIQLSGNYMSDNNHLLQTDMTATALSLAPDAPRIFNEDGSLNWSPNGSGVSTFRNPLAYLYNKYSIKADNLIGNLRTANQALFTDANYSIIKGEAYGLRAMVHFDLLRLGASYEECAGMGATLSLCWFSPEWMYFGHIGDSRIYYLPVEGGLNQITHDHSYVGKLRRAGVINERQARTHPRRNALQQALGAGNQFIEPQIGAVGYRPGDRFLICSDGLTDGLWDRQLEEMLRAPAPADAAPSVAQRLVEESVQTSGRDNTTAVVIEIPTDAAP